MAEITQSAIRRGAFRAGVVLLTALVAAGCAGNQFWSTAGLSGDDSSGKLLSSESPHQAKSSLFSSAKHDKVEGALTLARLSERRQQWEQAERLYQGVIERDPQNPVPYHRLGVMCARRGRLSEADQYFTKALERSPSDPRLLSDIGYCYYLQSRLDEAREMLRRAHELEPNDQAISNNLALVLGEQGHYEESLGMFRRTGSEAKAYANLAYVYAQRGELEQAKASYSRALTLDHNLRPAAEAMVQLAQHEQQYASLAAVQEPSLLAPPGDQMLGRLQTEPAPFLVQDSYTQPATFLADEPAMGSVEVSDFDPPVPIEQTGFVAEPSVLAEPSSTSVVAQPSRPAQRPDLWDQLHEMVSQPGLAEN